MFTKKSNWFQWWPHTSNLPSLETYIVHVIAILIATIYSIHAIVLYCIYCTIVFVLYIWRNIILEVTLYFPTTIITHFNLVSGHYIIYVHQIINWDTIFVALSFLYFTCWIMYPVRLRRQHMHRRTLFTSWTQYTVSTGKNFNVVIVGNIMNIWINITVHINNLLKMRFHTIYQIEFDLSSNILVI